MQPQGPDPAERELAATSRALRMLSRCNEALVRAQDEKALLDRVCQIAVDIGGYRMASVLFADDDSAQSLRCVACAGHEAGYFQEISISWSAERGDGQGPAGRALRSGEPVVCEDLGADPRYALWWPAARVRGYRSVVSLPLTSADRLLGVFGLYSAEPRSIGPAEVELLRELADDLAFGLIGLRMKIERQLLLDTATEVSDLTSGNSGPGYFERLLKVLVKRLGAQAGVIAGTPVKGESRVRAICAVVDGETVEDFTYDSNGAPCEELAETDDLVIERGVRERHAGEMLARLGAEAYVGRSLIGAAGDRIGRMFVVYREPLKQPALAMAMLRIFAVRVAGEIVRQRDEARLRDQARLLDNARDAIFVRDLDDRILYWYAGAERVYGWSAPEVVGRRATEFKVVDEAGYREATAALLRDGEWMGEVEERRKDGERIRVECRWSLVRGEGGAPRSVLAINTDVTERRRAEERLAESEARGAHAQRLESIGQLTGGIAHDFNNLLTVIIGNADQLCAELGDQPQFAELARMVRTAGERGAELTNRLLAFARRQALEPRWIDLPGVVQGMLGLLRRSIGEHIAIEAVLDPHTWPAYVDPSQLELAILNLCINARDAMPNGGRLFIETSNVSLGDDYVGADVEIRPGDYAVIAIADTGVGIAAEHLPRVFEPFFTTKALGKGTGLGLSMVYGFARQTGGTARIYSEPGAGTVVKLYLPRAATGRVDEPAAPREPDAARAHAGAVVLLVEDDPLVRSLAIRLLEGLGYRVLSAADGPQALTIARGDARIDLLFTDVMMPGGMTGPQLAAAVRALRPHTPVLYTSGYTENAIVHHSRVDAGIVLLHKPYDRRMLAEKLQAVFAAARD